MPVAFAASANAEDGGGGRTPSVLPGWSGPKFLDEVPPPLRQLHQRFQKLVSQRRGRDGDNALRGRIQLGKPVLGQRKLGKAIEIQNKRTLIEPRCFSAFKDPDPRWKRHSGGPRSGRAVHHKHDRPRHGQTVADMEQPRAAGLLAGGEERLDECAFRNHDEPAVSPRRGSTSTRRPASCAAHNARHFPRRCARGRQERAWRSRAPRRR